MTLPVDEVRRIAMATAEAVFGPETAMLLDVSAGPDWSGDFAYFLDFTLVQDRDRNVALDRRFRLRSDIRDRLETAGDETFPYVRVLNRVVDPTDG